MMKNILYIAAVVAVLFQLTSCKEEITVTTEYKEVPVIYGLLDQTDTFHYVKINRGFVGPGNALEFAKIADSNYFANVSAKIEEIMNNSVVRTFPLRDTILTGVKSEGAFYGPDQKVYYFHTLNQAGLNPSATYRLTVDINEGKLKVTGETRIVNDVAKSNTMSNDVNQFKFADDVGEYISQNVGFSPGTSVFADLTMKIHISEFRGANRTRITIPWKINQIEVNNNNYNIPVQGQNFFETIANNVTQDATIDKRNFDSITLIFTGGAPEFLNYITVNKPSSSLAQNKPTYTNLNVNEGYTVVGIFSSRQTTTLVKRFVNGNNANLRCLDVKTTRELCQGSILLNYFFCSQHPGDIGGSNPKPYACQ